MRKNKKTGIIIITVLFLFAMTGCSVDTVGTGNESASGDENIQDEMKNDTNDSTVNNAPKDSKNSKKKKSIKKNTKKKLKKVNKEYYAMIQIYSSNTITSVLSDIPIVVQVNIDGTEVDLAYMDENGSFDYYNKTFPIHGTIQNARFYGLSPYRQPSADDKPRKIGNF